MALFLAFTLPFLMTVLGAVLIFFFNKPSKTLNVLAIGLATGIMLSASIWSLLIPAFDNAKENYGSLYFIPVAVGFILGGFFMIFLDFVSEKMFKNKSENKKPFKLFTAITIHNIPEGLAVGFAVGSAIALKEPVWGALMVVFGIALQNFPEGLATALPINQCLHNRKKAFWLGSLSGAVEPIFAILGYFLATQISILLPWLLSFSAGAMIYVIIEELMPELQENKSSPLGTWSVLIGFVAMMLLDLI